MNKKLTKEELEYLIHKPFWTEENKEQLLSHITALDGENAEKLQEYMKWYWNACDSTFHYIRANIYLKALLKEKDGKILRISTDIEFLKRASKSQVRVLEKEMEKNIALKQKVEGLEEEIARLNKAYVGGSGVWAKEQVCTDGEKCERYPSCGGAVGRCPECYKKQYLNIPVIPEKPPCPDCGGSRKCWFSDWFKCSTCRDGTGEEEG